MCGIAGCFSKNKKIDRERFERMVNIVSYRGPDDCGIYYKDDIALGHRRLSIIDTSRDGHQPFLYKDKYIIVYNGEIYNYIELRDDLQSRGYRFKTKSDTEVLGAAYDYYGEKCTENFNGMWAFAIYDIEKKCIFCSRDRFGVKPLYYYNNTGDFLFSSEIKQILCMLDDKPVANIDRLRQFVIGGVYETSEETLFYGIKQVPPGCSMILDLEKGDLQRLQYYDLKEKVLARKKYVGSYEKECKKLKELFIDAVRLRMRSDVEIGFCLSGGLDSSAIVSCAADILNKKESKSQTLVTVTSCSKDPKYDEQEYADEVINYVNAKAHKVYPKKEDLFDRIDEILWHMDEPFISTSIFAGWNVFKSAKEANLTVMLDGQGADEQLAGYDGFYYVLFADLIKHFKFGKLYKEYSAFKNLRLSTERWRGFGAKTFVKSMLIAFCPNFIFSFAYKNMNPEKALPFTKEDKYYNWVRSKDIAPIRNADRFVLDNVCYKLRHLLHYEDRNSMASSIETRLPFLDYRVVEAVCAMPLSYKIRNGITKMVLRDALKNILPEKIRGRYSKLGFVTEEDKWINDNYDEFRSELVRACDKLEGIVDKKLVLRWFDSNKGKIKREDFTTWRIICAGRWVELFDVQIPLN